MQGNLHVTGSIELFADANYWFTLSIKNFKIVPMLAFVAGSAVSILQEELPFQGVTLVG